MIAYYEFMAGQPAPKCILVKKNRTVGMRRARVLVPET